MFAIVNADTGAEMLKFDSIEDAKQACTEINESWRERGSEFRVRIKKVEEWTEQQLTDARYRAWSDIQYRREGCEQTPWHSKGWQIELEDRRRLYAHCKIDGDRTKVRFCPDTAHLMAGKWVTMSPGGFLAKHALDPDGARLFGDAEVQAMVLEWDAAFAERKLFTADTADGFERVYQDGPRSCMRFDGNHYAGPEHPCRVYAAGDLAVAYFTDTDERDGKPKARAIVWPDEKVHGRIYGDSRIEHMLADAGYTSGSLSGARVSRIECEGGFVLPYIDGAYAVDDHGTHFTISDGGDTPAESTDGVTYTRDNECAHCGYSCNRDDMYYAEDSGERYCCDCIQHCGDCGESLSPDHEFHYVEDSGEYVCSGCECNYSRCEGCGDLYECLTCGEDCCTEWCNDCAAEHTCNECGYTDSSVDDNECDTCRTEREEIEAAEDEDEDDDDTDTDTDDESEVDNA